MERAVYLETVFQLIYEQMGASRIYKTAYNVGQARVKFHETERVGIGGRVCTVGMYMPLYKRPHF